MNKYDYITVLRSEDGSPINKLVKRTGAGRPSKFAFKPPKRGLAKTVHVPDQRAMVELLQEVAQHEDVVIVQGFIPGTEDGEDFLMLWESELAKVAKGVPDQAGWCDTDAGRAIARKRENFLPSSWIPFDRDAVRGMPDYLAKMSEAEWLEAMDTIARGLQYAGIIRVPSTTGRVLVDGQPMEASGVHYWTQTADAEDFQAFGHRLALQGYLHGFGFKRPLYSTEDEDRDKVVGHRDWYIWDPTTFCEGRVLYDGKPAIKGDGLEVAPPDITVLRESQARLVLRETPMPNEDELKRLLSEHNIDVVTHKERRQVLGSDGKARIKRAATIVRTDIGTLKPETVLDLGDGNTLTVLEYWRNPSLFHVRCQTPFRESTSMNGFISRRADGRPFVFDNGSRVRYDLSAEQVRKHRLEVAKSWVEKTSDPNERREILVDAYLDLPAHERPWLKDWAVDQESLSLTRSAFNEMVKARKAERDREAAVEKLNAGSERVHINWDEDSLEDVVAIAAKACSADTRYAPMFSRGDMVVTVEEARPVSSQQIRHRYRDAQGKEDTAAYHAGVVTRPQNTGGLPLRLLQSCRFITQTRSGPIAKAPSELLVKTFLAEGAQHLRPLAGVVNNPVVGLDGEVITGNGYHEETGYYFNIHPSHVPDIGDPGLQEAQESLQWLQEVMLAEFPFDGPVSRDTAVSLALTLVQKPVYPGPTPMFAACAPVQSSGKTELICAMSSLAVGVRPTPLAYHENNEREMENIVAGLQLASEPLGNFDNLEDGTEMGSTTIAKAVTTELFAPRLMFKQQLAPMVTPVLTCTGNNIRPGVDFVSRMYNIYLDPGMENPEKRKFSRNLDSWCRDHRGEFYFHACRLLAAYYRSGEKPAVEGNRFEGWSDAVRLAIIWAGGEDVDKSLELNQINNPEREGRVALLRAWYDHFGSEPVSAADVVTNLRLHDALDDIFVGGATSKGLSRWLGRLVNRVYDGYRVRRWETDKGFLWRVEKVDE